MSKPVDSNPYAAPPPVSDWVPDPLPRVGSILVQGARLIATQWVAFAVLFALIWVPYEYASSYFEYEILDPSDGLLVFLIIPIEFAVESFATAAVIAIAIMIASGKEPATIGALIESARVLPRFVWTYFLCTIAITLGTVLLIVPGLWLTVRLSLVDSIVVRERRWGLEAMRASFSLSERCFWPLAGLCLVFAIVTIVPVILFFALVDLHPSYDNWAVAASQNLVVDILNAYPTVCLYLAYRRLMLDRAEMQRSVEAEKELKPVAESDG